MNIDHILLQYQRLERHYTESLKHKDPISFLDLSHCLRIWVDMKSHIDIVAKNKRVSFSLSNTATPNAIKKMLKGNKYTYLPLGSGVESPGVEARGFHFIHGALTDKEWEKIAKAGPPVAQLVALGFAEWLASGIYEVPSNDDQHPIVRISREILIKRVANILGASHPIGSEDTDEQENKFDPYVLDLHNTVLAGYPATYYQLLEIAKDILEATKVLFPQ